MCLRNRKKYSKLKIYGGKNVVKKNNNQADFELFLKKSRHTIQTLEIVNNSQAELRIDKGN